MVIFSQFGWDNLNLYLTERSSRTLFTSISDFCSGSLDFGRLNNFATSLRNTVNTEFSRQGYDQGVEMKLYVDLRYEGQNYEISVQFDFDHFDKNNMDKLRNQFDSEFDEKYGFCLPGEPIEIVNLSVTGIVEQPKPDIVAKYDETTSKPKTYS